jgi:CBS domain-containing protein
MTKVREIMSTKLTVVDDNASVEQAAAILAANELVALPVRGSKDARLKGVLTEDDLFKARMHEGDTVGEIVSAGAVPSVAADQSVEEATEAMRRHRVGHLAVLEGHELAGIVTEADVSAAQLDQKVDDLQ